MKFIRKDSSHSTLHIGYKEKYIEETNNTKFLVSEIDIHIKWKNHIKEGTSKLSGAALAVRSVFYISNVHSQITVLCILLFCYKIWNNFGGNSSCSWEYFTLHKKIVRIMAVAQPRTSCISQFNQSRDSACSTPVYTVINELHYLLSGKIFIQLHV